MAGWHSLSGYLQYKSGNNALGRLIPRRKVWCILEESECLLLLFKTEEDVHKHCQPHGHIDLHGAAISLDLEHHNQFIILSDKKEHVFTAENHESMMIWLLGLQAKRDLHSKKMIANHNYTDPSKTPSLQDYELWGSQPSLYMTYDQQHSDLHPHSKSSSGLGWHRYQWTGESHARDCSRLSHARKSLESSRSFPVSSTSKPGLGTSRQMSYSHTILSCDSDCDDVFGRDQYEHRQKPLSPNWRKLQTAVLGHVLHSQSSFPRLPSNDRCNSSRSASSDSAIEKGEGTPQELTLRLGELERELISTKCELAKVMNRQTCYQELLQYKDDTIKHLAEQGGDVNNTLTEDNRKSRSPVKRGKLDKEFQEKIRVLQNQNRFLNEEVKKLAKLRLQEHGKYQEQNTKLQSLEAEIEKWKIDYVSLIQSSLHCPRDEGVEDVELTLYGGDRHKERVQSLTEEARKINPRLPTYESLANKEVHVDSYGFKHVYSNTGLLLQYMCTELTHHYLVQAGVFEEHQKRWTTFMRQHGKEPMKCLCELKPLCRGGIPDRFRKLMWRHLVRYQVRDVIKNKGDYYFRNLCNMLPDSPLAACYRKQVSLDLMRTMPGNVKFSSQGSKGIMDLQDVLLAFCIHNPTIGYCQGMNFIVGMALIFLDPEDAFWTLVAVAESYFSPHYFDHSLIGAQSDQHILKDMVQEKLPALAKHLEGIDIELSTITLNWFLAVFFDAVPFQTLLRIWDCFLLEGPKVLFRFAIAILKLHEKDILQKTDTMGIMKHLKACAKLTYDVDGLVKLSFKHLKPFPKRKDITTKQTCYLNALKEKYKKKELQRLAFAEREQMYMSLEAESGSFMGIECAVTVDDGKVWFCYGDQNIGKVSYVSCDQGTMCPVDYKLDSRLMCMCTRANEELLLGTISWMLVSVDMRTHEQLWQIQLHDAILSVCCYDDDEVKTTRVFSGLADGTVAVTEQPYRKSEPNVDVMYIPIGQAPVTCLMLLGEQLWCASGNTVAIIHAKTLDAMDTFSVSVNPYDHILCLIPSDYGIWISLRGSSILELWDPQTLNCRMLYDTRTDRYPQLRKEDDTYFNRARITSTLAYGNTIWVGTGEGNLIIYEILECAQLMTPTDQSPSNETTSSMSYIVRPEKTNTTIAHHHGLRSHGHQLRTERLSQQSSLEVLPDSSDELKNLSDDDCGFHFTRSGDHVGQNLPARCSLRRRSSSETNIEMLQFHRYLKDGGATTPDTSKLTHQQHSMHGRNCSENDLENLEWIRNNSQGGEEGFISEHSVEDEMECKMEAYARRESFSKMQTDLLRRRMSGESRTAGTGKDSGSSRRSSIEQMAEQKAARKRHMLGHHGNSDSYKSDDSCGESKGQAWRGRRKIWTNSNSQKSMSSTSGMSSSASGKDSLKRKLFASKGDNKASTEKSEADGEDSFEAGLEEQARRQSLVNIGLLPEEVMKLRTDDSISDLENGVTEKVNIPVIKQQSTISDGTISIYLNSECSFEDVIQSEDDASMPIPHTLRVNVYDDDYLSSSPCTSITPSGTPSLTPVPIFLEKLKKTTPLGMSIDSTDLEGSDHPLATVAEIASTDDSSSVATSSDFQPVIRSKSIEKRQASPTDHNESSGTANFASDRKDSVVPTPAPPVTRPVHRKSSVIEDISVLCSDCRTQKQRCNECAKLLQSQASLMMHERRLSQSLSPSEDLNLMKKFGGLNGLKSETINDPGTFNSGRCNSSENIGLRNGGGSFEGESRNGVGLNGSGTGSGSSGSAPKTVVKQRRKTYAGITHMFAPDLDELRKGAADTQQKPASNKLTRKSINKEIIRKLSTEESSKELLRKISQGDGRNSRKVSLDENYKPTPTYNTATSTGAASEQVKLFPVENQDKGDLTRQDKVGYWLSSISRTISIDNEDMRERETTPSDERQGHESDVAYTGVNRTRKISRCMKENVNVRERSKVLERSRSSDNDEDVFYNTDDRRNSNENGGMVERPNTLNLMNKAGPQSQNKRKPSRIPPRRIGSTESEGSSYRKSHLNKSDPEAQYRLDFSNVNLDTDVDSEAASTPVISVNKAPANSESQAQRASIYGKQDSRKNSLDLGSIQEKCSRLESETTQSRRQSNGSVPGATSDRQKIFEFLKTPSLASRQASLGLKIIDNDMEWTDLFSAQYTTPSPSSSCDKRFFDFLRTPSISSKPSSLWSSYENISTPSQVEPVNLKLLRPAPLRHQHSPSTVSIDGDNELLFNVDLNLEAKMKISDKPIKCLLATSCNNEPLILSFSGSFGDDEAVLKWRKQENEQLWTNEPILEFCPKTKQAILPTYMRPRISSNSSYNSHSSSEFFHAKK